MNSIELIAVVKDVVDDIYRYVEYDLPFENEEEETTATSIARYWVQGEKSRFTLLENGTLIALRGHLDVHPKFGTIVIVEQFNVLKIK